MCLFLFQRVEMTTKYNYCDDENPTHLNSVDKKLFQDVAESFKHVFLAGRLLKDVGRNTTDLTEAIL